MSAFCRQPLNAANSDKLYESGIAPYSDLESPALRAPGGDSAGGEEDPKDEDREPVHLRVGDPRPAADAARLRRRVAA